MVGVVRKTKQAKALGDQMRIWNMSLIFLVLFAVPQVANAQQSAASRGKDAQSKSASNVDLAPSKAKENWLALDDLKTGLEPRAPVLVQTDEQPDFVRELIRVQWRPIDEIDLWVTRPKGTNKVPVILYLYSYLDGSERFRDNGWCKRATADGFAAVGFSAALTDYRFRLRPMREWFVSELPEALGTTVHDVQFILNYLADRGDMDMDHVGMFGMGSGAAVAILAAHADPRIKTLDVLDPWGDWPDWLKESPAVPDSERSKYLTPEFLKSVATLDPADHLAALKTRSIRLQQTLSEHITPNDARKRIAAAVPAPNQLVQYGSPQDLFKAWQVTGLSGWIKQQMLSENPRKSGDDGPVALR
jgi:X-Pro dipeptidyl-peptidase-like protein